MRRFLWLSLGALLLAGIAVASSGGATQAETRWVITDLGTLGGRDARAAGVNDVGDVVGRASVNPLGFPIYHAFLWQEGKMRDLGTLGGEESQAEAINNRGQVVGISETRKGEWHAFLWQNGRMRDLGTLGGEESKANDINNRGQIVGSSATKGFGNDLHAFLWQNGKMRDLGTLGGSVSSAVALNDRGQVVGTSRTKSDAEHIFLWEKGRMTDLGLGAERPCSYLVELAINDRTQIVMSLKTGKLDLGSKYDKEICHGYMWQSGKLRDLTPGAVNSAAEDIDDHGQVVGAWWRLGNTYGDPWDQAVLWQDGKRMIRLGSLYGPSRANAINERGQIVGWSDTKGGGHHAVLWTLKR